MDIWTTPSDYAGYDPVGHFGVITRHRDSELIDRVNWDAAEERMAQAAGLDAVPLFDGSDPADTPAVYSWEASHWAVGWVRYMMVRPDAPQAVLDEAESIREDIEVYPFLDEVRHSELEWVEVCESWEQLDVRWRLDTIRESGSSVSPFAARRSELPADDDGLLFDYLRS